MNFIDFRSDTVTWPTAIMREAMASAKVGDDVYGEDPTVNELESKAARMMGMEAGLLVASGTMGNITAILSHTSRGDEAIIGEDGHVYRDEAGGISSLAGVIPRPLPTDEIGRMDISQMKDAIRPDDPHFPRSRLILLENSYGARSGAAQPPQYFGDVRKVANEHGLSVHLDGARIFNAAIALNIEVEAITRYVDSVSFCLSKGLCAPVGSILCGSAEFVHSARRSRKVLGGGMRQAGIIAAAGLVSLDRMVLRLAEDHANARYLAQQLSNIEGINIDASKVQTNIVFFELDDEVETNATEVTEILRSTFNIGLGVFGPRRFRALTHLWVEIVHIDLLVDALDLILREARTGQPLFSF